MHAKKHPLKGYKQTAEHIAKRVVAHIGKPKSADHKHKISASLKGRRVSKRTEFKRGRSPWNKGTRKYQNGNCVFCGERFKRYLPPGKEPYKFCSQRCAYKGRFGHPTAITTKLKISQAHKGRKFTTEHKAKL